VSDYVPSGKIVIDGKPCTGSLLLRGKTYDYVLTAHHCLPDQYIAMGEPAAVELPVPGAYSYSPDGDLSSPRSVTTAIRGVIIAPDPSQVTCKLDILKGLQGCPDNDIAILVIEHGIVAPLTKAFPKGSLESGTNVYITGYGKGSLHNSRTYTGSSTHCGTRIREAGVICLNDENGNIASGDSGAPGIVFLERIINGKKRIQTYAVGTVTRAELSTNDMLVNPILSNLNSSSNARLLRYVEKFESSGIPLAKARAPVYHTIQKNGPVYAVSLVSSGNGLQLPGDANTNVTLSQPDNTTCFVHAARRTQTATSVKSKVDGKVLTTISDLNTSPFEFVLTLNGTDCVGHDIIVADVSVSSRDLGDLQLRSRPISPDNDRLKPSKSTFYFPLITRHSPSAREVLDKQGFELNGGTLDSETWNR